MRVGSVASTAKLPSLPGLGDVITRLPVDLRVGVPLGFSAGTVATWLVRSSCSRNEMFWPSAYHATFDIARSSCDIYTGGLVAGPADAGGFAGTTISLFMPYAVF